MKDWVETQIKQGRHDSASGYVHDLIRHGQNRALEIETIQKLVDEVFANDVGEKGL